MRDFIKNMLKEGGGISMMRVSLLVIIVLAVLLVLTLSSYVVLAILMSATIEWGGMATFLTAVAGFMAPAFVGKALQKKHEKNSLCQDQL
jgi:hypothetical protein